MNLLKSSLLATAMLAAAPMAMAAAVTAPLNVTLTLENNCVVATAPVAFGTSNTLATAIDGQGSVTVTCTSTGGSYDIAFNGGTTPTGTIAQRKMVHSGGNTINYNLYTTATRNVVLGDGTNGVKLTGTGNGSAQVYPVFGQVAAGQDPKAVGSYSDSVTVTVSF
jgi:spore coat protein U-like protein